MYKCMICSGTRSLVKGGEVVLCERCLGAIYSALKPQIRRKKSKKGAKSPKKSCTVELAAKL